jgi:hypothetical protein
MIMKAQQSCLRKPQLGHTALRGTATPKSNPDGCHAIP